MYDYLVVGSGLFGSVFAHEAKKAGKKVIMENHKCRGKSSGRKKEQKREL